MPIGRMHGHAQTKMLEQMPLFSACTDRELRRIASLVSELDVEEGRVLTVAGQPGEEFFVVVDGSATVWRQGIRLGQVGPGSFFGELALLDRGDRTATVVADTEMRLIVLTAREFRGPHFFITPVLRAMLGVVSERLRHADEGWANDVAVSTRFDPQRASGASV